MQSVSFDVFETVVQRSVWPPSAVYACVGERLHKDAYLACAATDFAAARERAEHKAFGLYGPSYNLTRIYGCLENGVLANGVSPEECLRREVDVEMHYANGVPQVLKAIDEHRQRNDHIVFVSDTYFAGSVIKALLEKVGAYQEGDDIFVSNDFGAFKRKGRLFKRIAQTEKGRRLCRHYGNSLEADVHGARSAGIQSEWIERGNATFLESAQEPTARASLTVSRLLGAQRVARNRAEAEEALSLCKVDVATGLLSPLNISLLLWSIAKAKAQGITKIYLLARDGWLMHQMVMTVSPEWFEDVEIKYLYVSREALAANDRGGALSYLEREGVVGPDPVALVDVGWRGSLHEAVCRLRVDKGFEPCWGYFLGLDNCDNLGFGEFRSSMIEPSDFPARVSGRIDPSVKFVVEAMFCAPHGSLKSFSTSSGGLVPVLDPSFTDTQDQYGYWSMCSLAMEVFRLFANACSLGAAISAEPAWADCVRRLLNNFCFAAPSDLAAELGDLPVESDATKGRWQPLAPEYSWREICTSLMSGRLPQNHERQWAAGSWLRAHDLKRLIGTRLIRLSRRK